ncbi:MAG: alpha/beta hydrolase [Thermodesulfobacteriota bacterium]
MALASNQLSLVIPTSDGPLEGVLLYADNVCAEAGVLLCPPHPLLAGNMDNNVVRAVASRCAGLGLAVLLFNYRAVGRSFRPEPELPLFEYWHRLDTAGDFTAIIEDAQAVLQLSRRYFQRQHLIGYSFGAYIAAGLIDQTTASYTAITPPLMEHDFSPLNDLAVPGLLVEAENEPLLAPSQSLIGANHILRRTLADTDHFFLGREEELAGMVAGFVAEHSPGPQ